MKEKEEQEKGRKLVPRERSGQKLRVAPERPWLQDLKKESGEWDMRKVAETYAWIAGIAGLVLSSAVSPALTAIYWAIIFVALIYARVAEIRRGDKDKDRKD